MKCHNCKCQVSPDFKYAFATNCCPKCGDTLMPEAAKPLYLKIQDLLSKDNNDIGDLAVWLANSYLPNVTDSVEEVLETSLSTEEDESFPDYQPAPELGAVTGTLPSSVVKKKPSPIKTSKEQKLLNPDRTNIFAKRAGVDKIKFETLIKDIQGNVLSNAAESVEDYGDESGDSGDFGDFNESPLSRGEMHEVAGLFESDDSSNVSFTEIEKLQKLEQLSMSGSVGKIRRSS